MQNIAQIRKHLAALISFKAEVTHQHRLAYDNGRRLIGEALAYVRRGLGRKNETLATLQCLQRLLRLGLLQRLRGGPPICGAVGFRMQYSIT
jgi:hypothetical protein